MDPGAAHNANLYEVPEEELRRRGISFSACDVTRCLGLPQPGIRWSGGGVGRGIRRILPRREGRRVATISSECEPVGNRIATWRCI